MDFAILNNVSYGMYIISSADGMKPAGCIANTLIQITSENPIFAVSLNKKNFTYETIMRSKKFSASILSEGTKSETIGKFGFFSSRDTQKFRDVGHDFSNAVPYITERACGAMLFEVVSVTDMETHAVIFGRLTETIAGTDSTPMTYSYYHTVLKGKASKLAPTYREEKKPPSEAYVCDVCGYVYEGDISAESEDYKCPVCGVSKSHFKKKN